MTLQHGASVDAQQTESAQRTPQLIADNERDRKGTDRPPADPTKEQAIATKHRHLVIRASAGSGKTYQLALRYLQQLLQGEAVDQILATTFTRKAAGEILARVVTWTARAARDDRVRQQLAVSLGLPELRREQCLDMLQHLTRQLHRVRITTLDSFFSRLATSFTLELGLPPGWSIIDELDDRQLRRRAIETIVQSADARETQRLTNLVARSDAGRRVSTLLFDTVKHYYDVYLRTDEAAWHDAPRTGLLSAEALAATIEELRCVELPKHGRVQNQQSKDCQHAIEGDWEKFIQTGIAACLIKEQATYYGKEIPPDAVAVYLRLIEHARGVLVKQLVERTAATCELLTSFDTEYQKLKQETRGLRFDDVTLRLADAFRRQEGLSQSLANLAYRLDGDVSHLMLDEFQDTSLAQWEVLRPFAERVTSTDRDTSFFCVGDVKQAIYRWRNGVAELVDVVESELTDVASETLACSFRSSQVIIDVVNELFQKLPSHPNLQNDEQTIRRWCAAVEPHRTEVKDPGYVSLETSPSVEDEGEDTQTEIVLQCTVERVQKVVREAPDASVGILVRSGKEIAPIISQLRERGVEASEEGGRTLDDSAAVVLMLSLLRLADHPGHTIARHHVATSPLGRELGLTDGFDPPQLDRLAAQLRRRLVDEGYGPTLDDWSRRLLPACEPRDVLRLGQLVDLAYRYDDLATLRTMDFVRFVENETVERPSDAKVRVMTIHKAKGLEFDVVVLPLIGSRLVAFPPQFVCGGASPTARPQLVSVHCNKTIQEILPTEYQVAFAADREASVREELCVLYVAVTRAAHALHIVIPPSASNERNLPVSFAGLVRAALTDGNPVEACRLLYQHGDPHWARSAAFKLPSSDEGTESLYDAELPTIRLAEMAAGRRRGRGRVAPSQGKAAETVRLAQLVQSSRSAALERGTLIHAWFEQITWLEDGRPDKESLSTVARQLGHDSEATQRHLAAFGDMLARPTIARLLSQTSYHNVQDLPWEQADRDQLTKGNFTLEVARERSVAVRLEGELLVGTIDRLVLLRRGNQVIAADVIDYKTDAVGNSGAATLHRTEHYRRQLQSYVEAIGRIYRLPCESIAARLAFVETGEIVAVQYRCRMGQHDSTA